MVRKDTKRQKQILRDDNQRNNSKQETTANLSADNTNLIEEFAS
jgi:hypothetical protein